MTSTSVFAPIVEQSERYLAEHGDCHRGVGWPTAESALTHYRVMLDIVPAGEEAVTLLDVGCGYGGLYEAVREGGGDRHVVYTGIDVSDAFLAVARGKFAGVPFHKVDLLEHPDAVPAHDYVVANGIFTQKCGLAFDAMWLYMQTLLPILWGRTRRGLAFNMMSKHVNWERDDLFHLPMDMLAAFLTRHLTRRFVFRNDYGYYDYTAYVYR